MVNWRKVKTTLEWTRLGKFVFDLFVAIFSQNLVKTLLAYVPQVSKNWATVIAWAVAAAVLFVLIWLQEKRKTAIQGSASQAVSNTLLNSSGFNATAFFATAYTSMMHQDIESRVRAAAQLNNPTDREAFYLKLMVDSTGRCNTIWYKSALQRWCLWPKGNGRGFLRRRRPIYGAVGRRDTRCMRSGAHSARVIRQFTFCCRITVGLFRQPVGARS